MSYCRYTVNIFIRDQKEYQIWNQHISVTRVRILFIIILFYANWCLTVGILELIFIGDKREYYIWNHHIRFTHVQILFLIINIFYAIQCLTVGISDIYSSETKKNFRFEISNQHIRFTHVRISFFTFILYYANLCFTVGNTVDILLGNKKIISHLKSEYTIYPQ